LKGKIKFPSTFPKDTKSLVKHLLVADLAKRYGNLKRGVNDIKQHRWFKNFDWNESMALKITAPYIPNVKNSGDTSNYSEYPDSPELPKAIKPQNDVFLDW
jgi:23S rRNA A2030 N6-methylase RlmJ